MGTVDKYRRVGQHYAGPRVLRSICWIQWSQYLSIWKVSWWHSHSVRSVVRAFKIVYGAEDSCIYCAMYGSQVTITQCGIRRLSFSNMTFNYNNFISAILFYLSHVVVLMVPGSCVYNW